MVKECKVMIPKITVFVSCPSTEEEDKIVKRFIDLKFAPLVDANNKNNYSFFEKNLIDTPHKLFNFYGQSVFYYEASDLNSSMTYSPQVLISWNVGDIVKEQDWRDIREWLIYYFFKCYDYVDYNTVEVKHADELMKRPVSSIAKLTDEEVVDVVEDFYRFYYYKVPDRDVCLYEVRKPHTDLPYTSVIRDFSTRGPRAFFPSLFICSSWGVSKDDVPFLGYLWKQLEMEGEFDMDSLLKEATEKCYPSENAIPEPEPEVYRRSIQDVLNTLQCQEEGIQCGHVFNDIPEHIKSRFK
jgi:hypothetical protein